MNWGKGKWDGRGVALLGAERGMLKRCKCCRKKWGAWVLNKRSAVRNWLNFTERGGSIGDTVLLISGL